MPHRDPEVCAELTEMKHAIQAIGRKMDYLADDMRNLTAADADMERAISELSSAFPDGPAKHREAHELMIRSAAAQEKFWSEFWDEAKKKGMMLTMFALVGVIGLGFKTKVLEWISK